MELDVVNVSTAVAGRSVLYGVSFKLIDSECMGIVGPNGSGKTTLLRSIAGLEDHGGDVLFDRNPIGEVDFCSRGIFYLPDGFGSFSGMDVRENLEFLYRCYNKDPDPKRMKADIDGILDAARLRARAASDPKDLSPGMRRRLSIARTMVCVPELVLMDDPFANLDPEGRVYLEGYIRSLKRLGASFLICSHELGSLQRVCDSILFLKGGRVIARTEVAEGLDLEERYLSVIRRGSV